MSKEDRRSDPDSIDYDHKKEVHERDRHRCVNCGERFDDATQLDVDHIVPRGAGGSNSIHNAASECRRCHEAKHGERDHAPTVRFASTSDMPQKDFYWFKHLWKHQFPALTELTLERRINPKFNIADETSYRAWHVPIGDLRRLDRALGNVDDLHYRPLELHHYM